MYEHYGADGHKKHEHGYSENRGFGEKVWRTMKHGAVDALIMYPAGKLVWAVDSMGRNMLPLGMPQEARTPVVGLALAAIPQLFGDNAWTSRISELLLAQALVQTISQAGNKGTGLPGVIDEQVNKVFQPIASVGMTGYVEAMKGYVEQTMKGYVQQGGMGKPREGLRGSNNTLRGFGAVNYGS